MFERRLNNHPATNSCATGLLVDLIRLVLAVSLALALALSPSTLYAADAGSQNFSVQQWTTRNGLRTSAVASITQTMDGNLWIGTRAGLARFDGSQFKVFTPRDFSGLSSRYIDYVATGPDTTLYVGTDDTLCVFSHGHSRTFATNRGGLTSRVLMILPGEKDEAWIGTRLGVLFHYKNGAIEESGFYFPSEVAISGLAKTPDGALWLATTVGLFSISEGKMVQYRPAIPLPTQAFYDLSVSTDGTLFAASDVGLFGLQGNRWRRWDKTSGLPSNDLNVLTTDAKGVLWIGTTAGLARLEAGAIHPVASVSCSVHALFVDLQKSLWIGCDDMVGLFRLTSYQFRLISPPRAFDLASASLAVDRKGAVWIGSHGGLYKYANGHFRTYTHLDGLPSDWVNAVSVTPDDVVWVATKDGLARIDKGHIRSVSTNNADLGDDFFSVTKGFDGTLWATSERGLSRRLPGQTALYLEPGFTNLVNALYRDSFGAVWVSTGLHGLFRFFDGKKETYLKTCGIGSDTVYSSVQDDSGTMWAWTFGGLSRIRGDKCANIPADSGLPMGEPGSITYDGTGHLWLRTQDGVAAIDIAEANDVIESPRPLQKTRFVGSEEGLDSAWNDLETLDLLAVRAFGQVWIPTTAGIAVLDSSTVQKPTVETRPQVTSFVSDSGEHDITALIQLQPDDLHLQFTYRVPSLFGSSDRMYRYRLSGFDKSWREGQESDDATYTSIPAGTYTFEVISRQPFDRWSAVSDPVQVEVLPHFYRTWWWYSLLAITAAASIWLAYWFRLVALRKHYAAVFAERGRERSRLARELHDTLSRGMMGTHMQLQLARAHLPADPDTACTHLDAAVDIVRESAAETRRSIAALRAANEEDRSLKYLLDRAASNFEAHNKVLLRVHIDPDLPSLQTDVKHEIARIIDEALSNVLQHSGAQTAHLHAGSTGRFLRIQIVDDGRGFDFSLNQITDLGHFGIQGMRERAQTINATLTADCVPGKGTTVVLEVPLDSAITRA